MTVEIPAPTLAAIRREAEQGYPREVCGFLLGPPAAADAPVRVEAIRSAANTRGDEARTRYEIDPGTYRVVEAEADRTGREILGFYHSHPDAPARPSEYDREHAWPRVAYLIVAVDGGRADRTTAWRLAEDRGRFDRLELETTDDRETIPGDIERRP